MNAQPFPQMPAPPPPPPPPPAPRAHSTVGGVVLIVLGALVALVSLGLLTGGGVLMYADRTLRDASGYLTSPGARVEAPDFAIAATDVHLALADPGWHVASDALGSVRVTASGESQRGVFIGIGPRADVLGYLGGVAYDEPSRWLGASGFEYRAHPGGHPSAPPGSQAFWVAQTSGAGAQTLTWKAEPGHWAIVLMNPDASRGVAATVSVAATAPFLFALALGLLIGGGVAVVVAGLLLAGGILLVRPGASARGAGWPASPGQSGAGMPPAPAGGGGGLTYPLRFEGRMDVPPSRWLWLVKWLLLIPHYFVLAFLGAAAALLTVVAFFAIVITGRYPRSIFDFNVGVLRWWWRVSFYGYSALGTDTYPPFSLQTTGAFPATLEVPYPERLSRGLALVKWWLLAIPHYIIVGLLTGGATAASTQAGDLRDIPYAGLIAALVIIAAIALVFTGRYPRGIFDLVMGLNRWVYRVLVYVLLMRDEYPPFRLDPGGFEQPAAPAAPAATVGPAHPYGV